MLSNLKEALARTAVAASRQAVLATPANCTTPASQVGYAVARAYRLVSLLLSTTTKLTLHFCTAVLSKAELSASTWERQILASQ